MEREYTISLTFAIKYNIKHLFENIFWRLLLSDETISL